MATSATSERERETPHFTVISAASRAAKPPPMREAIHVTQIQSSQQDWPIKTCRSRAQTKALVGLVIASELSPDLCVL